MKFARAMLLAVLVFALGVTPVLAQGDGPFTASADVAVVDTEAGQLQGSVRNGVYTYLGIPYATAERFMMPEPVEPWEGVRGAMTYGEICPVPEMNEVANDELFNPHRYWPESENCQFLNVWTPAVQDDGARPVMVWFHGGGWTNGSPVEQEAYDGANLAAKGDVVVVSVAHRLNILGYLDLSAYGDEYASSGLVGVADMVAALEWVQANIAEFGGDPENVTIFGQSGGGAKVISLLSVPAAEGLMDKAIVQSGYFESGPDGVFGTPEWSQRVGELTVENLGLTADTVADIADVSYAELLEAGAAALTQVSDEGLGSGSWGPAVDGNYLPVNTSSPEFLERNADIPVMVGSVLNEFTTVISIDPVELQADNFHDWTEEYANEKLTERFGEDGAAVGEAFVEAYPNKGYADAYFVDTWGRPGVVKFADLMSGREDAPVYAYTFTYYSPVMDGVGMAWHCAEIPYAFDNVERIPQATGGDDAAKAMANAVSSAWINFARYGDPNNPYLPEWPAYTTENGATMILDSVSYVGMHHDAELLSLIVP
ncbi:MAG: carboxylesterase/lipase family protein [Caldilineaceae bacterium]|nr:carboxylesterase/lipase family protein [Caldilineaceae bacterium]